MGDRVTQEEDGLWYQGRSFQAEKDFELEQSIYQHLGHTRGFVFLNPSQERVFSGEGVRGKAKSIMKRFPEIIKVQEKKIIRDRRHRARIDRGASQ
jgi:hypothetical protein